VLAFPFRDEHATNRLLAGVGLLFLSIVVPIVPALIVYGYLLDIMRQAVDGQPATLPEWTDWGKLLLDGLKALVVGFVYMLPALFVLSVGTGLYCGTSFLTVIISQNGGPAPAAEGAFSALFLIVILVFFMSISVGAVLSLLGALPLPAAEAGLSSDDKLVSAFALGRLLQVVRANIGGYIVAWVVLAGLWAFMYWGLMIAYYTLVLACLVPLLLLPLTYYTLLVAAVLFGQAYRDGVQNLAKAK
jgi:hypothetical protein